MAKQWPYTSLTTPPTNLKEAIDWVLRVTGRDGMKNTAAAQPQLGCLCFLAKAVKDLLYDAKDPGSPGPSTQRYWNDLLLPGEQSIVQPVLQDLGLLGGSTSAASSTCAGGTEVIKALIEQLAQGLQKWVGWQDKVDECCLKGENGIGKKCDCRGGVGGTCCTGSGTSSTPCHQCSQCGTTSASKKCYLSAYCKTKSSSSSGTTEHFLWTSISSDSTRVHLLARIFLGSVCLIWSGLSQLGWLTKGGSGGMWETSELSKITGNGKDGLGSFMAAMGYDLDRLNGSGTGTGKTGDFVWKLLSGQEPDDKKNQISWQEFASVKGKLGESVAEYYSEIYKNAKEATLKTEQLCEQYPLLVLHILASGYFRAGSAGAKGIIPAPKAPSSDPRKPRTIREILYWLSALPYSQGYKDLVERMQQKYPPKEEKYSLEGTNGDKTELHKDKITHYLMAACGYCPLVLIGIQGTIEKEVDKATGGGSAPAAAEKKPCPKHKEKRNHRCDPKDIKEPEAAAQAQSPQQPGASTGKPLGKGQVCYGGYHLEVSQFGPLHGMYANGLFGFDMGGSAAQCLDQLRIYVYHCFYQLYFLRKQCGAGVESGAVLGWQSCRYGSGVNPNAGVSNQNPWRCEAKSTSNGNCKCKESASHKSPLMSFLCDGLGSMVCKSTVGKGVDDYPPIETHWTTKDDTPQGHFGTKELDYPKLCPIPMGWQAETSTGGTQKKENHFKDLTKTHKQASLDSTAGTNNKYPAHCTGNTLSHLLEYYCDPVKQHGTLVVLLRLLACITPTVPRTLGDLFGFYYYIVYIGGKQGGGQGVHQKLQSELQDVRLDMLGGGSDVVEALTTWSSSGDCNTKNDTLKCLYGDGKGTGQCSPYLCPLSGQQYGQLSPLMAGTYLSWLVYLIEGFKTGLEGLAKDYRNIVCKDSCSSGAGGAVGCGDGNGCRQGTHGDTCPSAGGSGSAGSAVGGKGGSGGVCGCASVVSCTGVLPVLYKYGFGYGDVSKLHNQGGSKKCDAFLTTLNGVLEGNHLRKEGSSGNLHHEINQLIYTTRLPWIFVLTLAWLVAVLYLAFGAIWPLDWVHMRSHCRGWFRKGSLSPWEVLMVGKKKGRSIVEYFGRK